MIINALLLQVTRLAQNGKRYELEKHRSSADRDIGTAQARCDGIEPAGGAR